MLSVFVEKFLAAALQEDAKTFLSYGNIEPYFMNNEKELYDFVYEHARKHGVMPKPETFKKHMAIDLGASEEPSSYYLDLLKNRYTEMGLKHAIKAVSELLKAGNKDPEKALQILSEASFKLQTETSGLKMVDFRDADALLMAHMKKCLSHEGGITTGWPSLDNMTNGLVGGDVLSVVGRPAAGKSFFLLYSALHAWEKHDVPVLFVSMEMPHESIVERLIAMHTHTPLTHIKKGQIATKTMNSIAKMLTALKDLPNSFTIVDGNITADVNDVHALCQQLKPGIVFVDGAYLLRHPNQKLDRYTRAAENCEDLKKTIAQKFGIPVITSWQFAKTATQKKKGVKAGLEDIGYTDVIAQISSVVIALSQEETVETKKRRQVDILKGRSGEQGQFLVNWDFDKMDFSEYDPHDMSEFNFV